MIRQKPVIKAERIPWKSATTTPSTFYLTAKALTFYGTNSGSVYVDTTKGFAGYQLAANVYNYAAGAVPLLPNWGGHKIRMSAIWVPNGTVTSGSVAFSFALNRLESGSAITAILLNWPIYGVPSGSTVTPVSTSYSFSGTALPTDIGNNEYLSIWLTRRGSESEDSHHYDIYLLGVRIEII